MRVEGARHFKPSAFSRFTNALTAYKAKKSIFVIFIERLEKAHDRSAKCRYLSGSSRSMWHKKQSILGCECYLKEQRTRV